MKSEILGILRSEPGYVSGQQLCERLHVSRTAVWKVIEQLKEEGYQIEAIRNRGYRLLESPDLLSEAEIESRLATRWAGRPVVYYEKTDSTNARAKRLGEEGFDHGALAAAGQQEAGRGRRGRSWYAPFGTNIYMTILLRPDFGPAKAPMLTLVMALATAEALQDMTGLPAKIKWPNDIVVNGKKICGILTEMSAEIDYISHVVIGNGINVNNEEFPEEIVDTATSLYLETGRKWTRSELIAAVMKRFEENYEIFADEEDLSGLQERYNAFLVNTGREVRVLEPGNEYTGTAHGITPTGELIVEKTDGTKIEIFAGEVSVRGIYNYV